MGAKIITEKDYWICTSGAVPAQLQSTQLVNSKETGERYITVRDKSTSSWLDFGCTKSILLYAIIAALVVVVAVVVVVGVAATGGAALIAIGALAGLAGGIIGAIEGALLCGQKMAPGREWVNQKTDFLVLGAETITGNSTMTCKAGGTVKFAANITSAWQALIVAGANYAIKLGESALIGAGIGAAAPAVAPLFTGGATLALPTAGSVMSGFFGSFTGVFGGFRAVSALDQLPNQIATGESGGTMMRSALFGAVPEAEFAHRIATGGSVRPTDALLLLYLLNIKTKTPEPAQPVRDNETTPQGEEPRKPNEEEPTRQEETPRPAEDAPAANENTGANRQHETFEDPVPIRPSKYGLQTIADDPVLHRLWQQSMIDAMNTGKSNAFTRYLDKIAAGQAITQRELEAAFAKIRDGFLPEARAAGYTIDEVHHWDYGKTLYPNQVVDPRNLVPVPDRATHTLIHQETSSGTNYFKDPIAPEHVLPVDESQMPIAPRPNE